MRFIIPLLTVLVVNSCINREETIPEKYLKLGGEITSATQAELLKNVSQAMRTGGPEYAIDFCNLRAMAIKDSLSRIHDCRIQRIAVKYRNPADRPQTKTEKDQLALYLDAHQRGDTLSPEVYLFEDRIEYYKPIVLNNGACLVCHGTPGEQIAEETLEMIEAKYPGDLATGFALNDFRGAWKITFKP
jgi:hypothetical protein